MDMKNFRLYLVLVKFSIKAQLKYPLDFVMQLFIWILYTFVPFLGLMLLLQEFGSVGNWSFYHIAFSYGILGLAYDGSRMVGRGFDNFHKLILSGNLDSYFIRPVNLSLLIMGNEFFLRRIAGLINYVLILIVAIINLQSLVVHSVATMVGTAIILALSTFLIFMDLLLFYASLCILTIRKNYFSELIIDNIPKLGYLPLAYLPKIVLSFFIFAIPLYFSLYQPLQRLFFDERMTSLVMDWLLALVVGGLTLVLHMKIFGEALRFYKSTGSGVGGM